MAGIDPGNRQQPDWVFRETEGCQVKAASLLEILCAPLHNQTQAVFVPESCPSLFYRSFPFQGSGKRTGTRRLANPLL